MGLLPAIAEPRLRQDVTDRFEEFQRRMGDERTLANYGLHAAQLPNSSTPTGRVEPAGTIIVPIPDPSRKRIDISDQFTFKQGRDLRRFAHEALEATESFIDGVLDAFQAANDRIRPSRQSGP